jgi:hypothetical protein
MIVVSHAATHEPVHGVLVRDGIKVLISLGELNFKGRHFYFACLLDGLSPFSVPPSGTGTVTTTAGASVSARVLLEFAILLIQVRNLLLELLYVSCVVLGLDAFQTGVTGPCMCVFGAAQVKLGLFDFLYQCRCLLFHCWHLY